MSVPTLNSIAKKCGVSHVTVWRALRGHPSVHPKTASMIRACAEEMGYVPPRSKEQRAVAREIFSRKAKATPSVIVPYNKAALTRFGVTEVFWEYVEGITEAAASTGTQIVMAGFENDTVELPRIQAYVDNGTDGVVDFGLNEKTLEYLHKREIPTVALLDRSREHVGAGVQADLIGGYLQGWRHLLGRGHVRIGFAGYDGNEFSETRRKACRAAAGLAGDTAELSACIYVSSSPTNAEIREAFRSTLGPWREGNWPTAFFCAKDTLAHQIIHALSEEGISVPDHLSLVGHDNAPVAQINVPAITTIALPRKEIGAALLHLLENLIAGRPGSHGAIQVMPLSFIERDTVSSPYEAVPPSLETAGSR